MKVKEQIQKTKSKEEALDWSFAEWVSHFSKEPTIKELDEMEKEALKLKAQNTPYYQPLQGA